MQDQNAPLAQPQKRVKAQKKLQKADNHGDSLLLRPVKPFLEELTQLKAKYRGYQTPAETEHHKISTYDSVFTAFPMYGSEDSILNALYSMPVNNLFTPSRQFDEFFIVRIFDNAKAGIAFQSFQNKIQFGHLDSLLKEQNGIKSAHITTLHLSNTSYKMFVHRLSFDKNDDWLLCGLVNMENYNQQTREVEVFILVNVSLVLLFILLAMPMLKLLLMSSIERLETLSVWFTGFSIATGTSVIFILILVLSHHLQWRNKVDSRLSILSNKIKLNFENELTSVHKQLSSLAGNPAKLDTLLKSNAPEYKASYAKGKSIRLFLSGSLLFSML